MPFLVQPAISVFLNWDSKSQSLFFWGGAEQSKNEAKQMREFLLFELARRLTHWVDTAPSSNDDLRSQAIEAVKTSIHGSVDNLLEGIEIPEEQKRQAIEHVTNTTPPDNLENLINGLHDLIVFQANSSSFQAILDFVNQIPPGGYVDYSITRQNWEKLVRN